MTAGDTSERIVVGVDGSESSIDALRRAVRIGDALDLPVEALTTWQYPPMISDGYYAPVDWSPEDDARRISAEALAEAFPAGAPARLTTALVEGTAASALIARSEGAFLLVLGSRGHGGFAGLLLGSVSQACAEHARCPVLIMHSGSAAPGDSVVDRH